jgi:cyclic pyranopterin phosphate synthase
LKKKSSALTHLDRSGKASMVNVSSKISSGRVAVAHAKISMTPRAFAQVTGNNIKKGDVFAAANLAGILAAKKTAELIPLCHPLNLSHVALEFKPDKRSHAIEILATCTITGQTGVEMEALTAVSVAALTLYDMAKAADRTMEISEIHVIRKEGGHSGLYQRKKK